MKMKNYRLFLLSFVTASFVLLTGFQKTDVSHAESQLTTINVKQHKFKGKESPVNSKQQETKNKHLVATSNNSVTEDTELQKPLDLSIPFNASDNAGLKTEQNRIVQKESATLFTNAKKKPRPVSLESEMLMSQEPEADKQKSLDGAGIVITLKR